MVMVRDGVRDRVVIRWLGLGIKAGLVLGKRIVWLSV